MQEQFECFIETAEQVTVKCDAKVFNIHNFITHYDSLF